MRSKLTYLLLACILLSAFGGFSVPLYGAGVGTHGLTGALLGHVVAQADWQAFLLGFASHALLDMMPHHDPVVSNPYDLGFHVGFNLTGLYLVHRTYLGNQQDSKIWWGAVGAMLPDLEHLFFADQCVGGNCPGKLYPSHNGMLPHRGDAPFVTGYLNESAASGISLFLSFRW